MTHVVIVTVAAAPDTFSLSTHNDSSLSARWGDIKGNCDKVLLTCWEQNDPTDKKEKEGHCRSYQADIDGLSGNGHYTLTIKTLNPVNGGQDSSDKTDNGWTSEFK